MIKRLNSFGARSAFAAKTALFAFTATALSFLPVSSVAAATPFVHDCDDNFPAPASVCFKIYASNGNNWVGGKVRDAWTDGHCVKVYGYPRINGQIQGNLQTLKTHCSGSWGSWSAYLSSQYDDWVVAACRADGSPGRGSNICTRWYHTEG